MPFPYPTQMLRYARDTKVDQTVTKSFYHYRKFNCIELLHSSDSNYYSHKPYINKYI